VTVRAVSGANDMVRDDVLDILRRHIAEIRAFGVSSLAVFGSVARGEERPDSDVDILVQFSEPVGLFEFVRVQRHLGRLLGRNVDLATPDALREEMRDAILQEARYVA
jgi:hypothetical protein